jgi:hypothetical protein
MFRPDPANELLERIVLRRKSLDEQLSGIKNILAFDQHGAAPLAGWKPRTGSGHLTFKEEKKGRENSLLLRAEDAKSVGAWWTTVWLEGGRYQVTGRARVQGLTADAKFLRSGAGFRVFSRRKSTTGLIWDWFPYRESNDLVRRGELVSSTAEPPKRLSGNSDWVELSYDFDLRQPAADLEISCELRADQGEAWFDLDSIKILRK